MKIRVLLLFLTISFLAGAQTTVIPLYEGNAPGTESWNWSEQEQYNKTWQTQVVYNVVKPSLTVFRPEAAKANGTAVVICPGGGFLALSINNEGNDVAKYLVAKGVTCFVLKYRLIRCLTDDPAMEFMSKMGKKEFQDQSAALIPMAVEDGRNAIAYVRKNAATYNISPDRIGIMGFSAGGTVCSSTLYDYTPANKPNFVAPIYPFFPAEIQKAVPTDAPPMFIAVASDDQLGLVPHSLKLYESWLVAKKPIELHVFASGGHGFGMRTQDLPSDHWIDRFADWMKSTGFLPSASKTINPDHALYLKKEFKYAPGQVLPYRILYPESYDKTKKYPLILFLHGGGERGNDNEKQLTHGAGLFVEKTNRKNYPAIVVVPQCPIDKYWATSTIDRTTSPFTFEFDYSKEPNWNLIAANELIKKLAQEESVDPSRIYVTGLSMGGMGTFESAYRYPKLYAAALPICGGGDLKAYDKRVKKIPFWIFHGGADAVVDVQLSRNMNDKLKSLKGNVKYTEYPGVNHNSWDNVFADPEYLHWMMAQKRK